MRADSYARDEFPRNPKSPTVRAETGTSRHPTLRGILLNPNATDTDGDGLADGQELFVKSVKTPKRYPTGVFTTVNTDAIDPAVRAPAWAIARVDAMVGFTHPDMGELSATLYSAGPSPNVNVLLRAYTNAGEANKHHVRRPAQSADRERLPTGAERDSCQVDNAVCRFGLTGVAAYSAMVTVSLAIAQD